MVLNLHSFVFKKSKIQLAASCETPIKSLMIFDYLFCRSDEGDSPQTVGEGVRPPIGPGSSSSSQTGQGYH
jgi:hypothetical protein